jgi:hypothetical protein
MEVSTSTRATYVTRHPLCSSGINTKLSYILQKSRAGVKIQTSLISYLLDPSIVFGLSPIMFQNHFYVFFACLHISFPNLWKRFNNTLYYSHLYKNLLGEFNLVSYHSNRHVERGDQLSQISQKSFMWENFIIDKIQIQFRATISILSIFTHSFSLQFCKFIFSSRNFKVEQ